MIVPPEIELDHRAYLADRTYRRKFRQHMRKAAGRDGVIVDLVGKHEGSGACCWTETWAQTLHRLTWELDEDGVTAVMQGPAEARVRVLVSPNR